MSVLGPPAVTLRLMYALAGQGGPLAGHESASADLRAFGTRVASRTAAKTATTITNNGPRRHATARKDIRAARLTDRRAEGYVAGLAGLRPAMTLSLPPPRVVSHQREGVQGRESGRLVASMRIIFSGR